MTDFLLWPPLAFTLLLAVSWLFYKSLGIFTLKTNSAPAGLAKPYSCGEEQTDAVQADYGQFFPFAFFFTILHVVALTVTTVPVDAMGNYVIAMLYVLGAIIGLSILYRS
jgi:hypothetical protein